MNVIKCLNGHFFDGDSFAVCPHCGANPEIGGAVPGQNMGYEPPKSEKKKGGLFGKKKKQQEQQVPANDPVYAGNDGYNGYNNQQYTPAENEYNNVPMGTPSTLDFWQTAPAQQPNPQYTPAQQPEYYATPKTVYPEYNADQQNTYQYTQHIHDF